MSFQKINKEEEYIARKEFERKQKIEEEKQKNLAKEERKRLQDLHYMRCPKCGMQLIEIDYKNIKVDECSGCKGVWLDAGELEAVAAMEKPALKKFFSIFSE
ncbi:MAG TPA: zf-TFIIB domain-containing protein [Smithellaceae bacterium]|nr:zf-TFIIB domain-containing protein [Smithellaceae bacterium]